MPVTTCSPSIWRWSRSRGYAYANWAKGYGDFHMVPDLATLRLADWLSRTAIVLCDLQDTRTHEPVTVAPRSILRRQLERAAAMGFSAKAASELEYFIFEETYRTAAEAGLRRSDPGRLVHRGLPPAAGRPRGAVQRSRAPAPGPLRHPGRDLQGGMGPRPARDEHPLRRCPRHGRSPRAPQAVHEGDGRRPRAERHLHGQAPRRRGRVRAATSISACGGTTTTSSRATWRSDRCKCPMSSAGSWAAGWTRSPS